jgi:hypothetical protein
MGCPALGIWVAFFKQPDALPHKNKKLYIFEVLLIHLIHLRFFINDFYFGLLY